MKTNELRVGNYLQGKDTECVVTAILNEDDVDVDNLNNRFAVHADLPYQPCLYPIPFTNEWANRIEPKNYDSYGSLSVASDKGVLNYSGGICYIHSGLGDDGSYGFKLQIKYVHQFQNIVKDLFGIEIKFKL